MSTGIIYIARNDESDEENHYKIGKSYKSDPQHRMKELTSDSTNYIGQYVCKGYVLVDDVDKCEKIIHNSLNKFRINPNREFFNVPISIIFDEIEKTLKKYIILSGIDRNGIITYDYENIFSTIKKKYFSSKIAIASPIRIEDNVRKQIQKKNNDGYVRVVFNSEIRLLEDILKLSDTDLNNLKNLGFVIDRVHFKEEYFDRIQESLMTAQSMSDYNYLLISEIKDVNLHSKFDKVNFKKFLKK